jgi:hypothetical protein
MTPCEAVVERLALGEPRDPDLDAHVATCPACARLVRVPGLVAATASAQEPAPGFSARMTVGARRRIAVRRRNRMATLALAAAGVLLAGGAAATRQREHSLQGAMRPLMELSPIEPSRVAERHDRDDQPDPAPKLDDDDLAGEIDRIANLDANLAPSADWSHIEAPLAPYRDLLLSYQGARP